MAAAYGHVRIAELLVRHGAVIDATTPVRTFSHLSCGKTDISTVLIGHQNGMTPLHVACLYDNIPTITLLLELGGSYDIEDKVSRLIDILAAHSPARMTDIVNIPYLTVFCAAEQADGTLVL
jgi:ankyrin repeat protein